MLYEDQGVEASAPPSPILAQAPLQGFLGAGAGAALGMACTLASSRVNERPLNLDCLIEASLHELAGKFAIIS